MSILFSSLRSALVLILFLVFSQSLFAQQNKLNYGIETDFSASATSDNLPFWFYANKGGTVDSRSANLLNQFYGTYNFISSNKRWSIETGFDAIARLSTNSSFHFTELYGASQYRAFQLQVGRFYDPIGLNNHDLSAGAMMMSKNAIPMPRIMIKNPDFISVPLTDDVVQFKGMFSHGWFTEDRYVDNPYLHQKYLYLRVNIEEFSGTGGIVHNAVWGGASPRYGRLPQSFTNYLNVVLASGASEESNAPEGEKSNVIGNSLGAYEFEAKYRFESFSISATRLFYLEDGVSRRFRSPWDGVWGTNFIMDDSNSFVSAVTYEHINTKQQDAKPTQELGQANYYNHSIYRNGWANYGQPIGLPLMTYNRESNRFNNNIIVAHHLGIKGRLSKTLGYKFFSSYARNYGTGEKAKNQPPGTINFANRREDQYSFLLDVSYDLSSVEGLSLHFSSAVDAGEFYKDSKLGFQLGVKWDGAQNR